MTENKKKKISQKMKEATTNNTSSNAVKSVKKDKEKTYWFPKISIKILPPTKFHVDESVKGRGRREDFSTQLYKKGTEN